jgi:hypothetical protein
MSHPEADAPETNAGPSALPGVRPRSNQSGKDSQARALAPSRVVVPQLEVLAEGLSAAQLQSVRTQVQPGDRVALYRAGHSIRVLLVGRERLWQHAPQSLAGGWRFIGAVEITDDGERALPVVLS